ncbi:DUF2975 domain-containing protein [Hyphomonas johnsonii]|uniref:DUF2975 domain-containing protein n=1 Tax=Hyphomonas johnsonii MHS-2 TaxID=1280950 RepID=A0A059FTX6_9PROT|nr:DUF2975 domain-containing protein [Hyphomonas johnsonii]KCZ94150.1 hypothetical protein HJO_02205 [Hyphomonas johnsonii MHS-2]
MESSRKSWLRIASAAFLVTIPILAAAILAGTVTYWGLGIHEIGDNTIVLYDAPPVAERRVYGLLATLVPAALLIYALWQLFRMFLGFNTIDHVDTRTIVRLKAFSLFTFLGVLAAFLLSGVMRWAIGEFDNAPLWTHLGFSAAHAAVMFCTAVIYVAASIIDEGYAYKRETEEYV